ncbi:uncharacterized protein LOC130425527 isoform X2 [Triplophysa dalaica]|uniref:uncharacterized protein LOC130425527 isoform X2 n=1 Tax=Triplophysa dalaica TaxID=1582913 RepID=UPI0024DFC0FC|nr:uncharacterized protein LOC130425527 isoform X2 [Triplophysa dalaica]
MPPKQLRCSVVGCKNEHRSLHLLPTSEPQKTQWVRFIFEGNEPLNLPKFVYVCANHFTPDCFLNAGQYGMGFAKKLILKSGSVPAVRHQASSLEDAETCISRTREVGCQTESPKLHSVGTQLSRRTLQSHYRSTGVQTTVSSQTPGTSSFTPAAIATVMSPKPFKTPSKRPRMELEEDDVFIAGCSSVVDRSDVTYDPADTSLTEPIDISTQASIPVQNIRKYIVYETCIMELFESCPVCQGRCDVRSQTHGTFLRVDQVCQHCNFSRKWNSQPIMGSTPAGNIHLSCAVYLCGASYITVEKVFAAMRLQVFRYNTFRSHARMYIEPAIVCKWKNWQDGMLNQMRRMEKVNLGGDMRANSSEHTAKFGSYTMMELQTNTVVDIQLIQSNEVGGGFHMEKEGLKRSLELIEARGVTLDSIVTDRHPQVQKFLTEKNVTQFYDVWHIEKAISKHLDKIANLKGCEKLRKWLPSIKNHIYWTAASSTTGPERVAKLTSILNHVQDKHTHEDPHFPACLHAKGTSRNKSKWLAAGTPLFYKLEKVLSNKRILKDVTKLYPHFQTSSVGSFHSIISRFTQKNVDFSFTGMLCSLYLAALHFNENTSRLQATIAEGQSRFKRTLPKAKKGQNRVYEANTEPTFCYVDDLLDLIFDEVFVLPAPYVEEVLKIPIPPPLSAEDFPTRKVSLYNLEAV